MDKPSAVPQEARIEELRDCINNIAYQKRGFDLACRFCGVVCHVPPGTARRFVHDDHCEVEPAMRKLDGLAASASSSTAPHDRYRWEKDAMKIVEAVKEHLLPAMTVEEGGWMLEKILDLTVLCTSSTAPPRFVEKICPFCGENDFDAWGLKFHLSQGGCDVYNETTREKRDGD